MALWDKARKLCSLPGTERRLLLVAVLLLGVCRIAVWLLPLRWLSWILVRIRPVRGRRPDVYRFAQAVTTASRAVPRATCFPQAMAVYILAVRSGWPVLLRVGVQKNLGCALRAHAWVEHAGRVLIGDRPDLGAYAVLLAVAPRW